jgi:hypothetical protein
MFVAFFEAFSLYNCGMGYSPSLCCALSMRIINLAKERLSNKEDYAYPRPA